MKNIFRLFHCRGILLLVFYLSIANQLHAQWVAVNSGLTNTTVLSFAVSGSNLFAGTWSGLFLSTNNGTSWTAVNTGLTDNPVYSLAVSGTILFAGTSSHVFLSTNNGVSWTAVDSGMTGYGVYALAIIDSNLFAGSITGGVFLSTNKGTSWTTVNTGLTGTIVQALAANGSSLFAGGAYGLFKSTNNGTNWTTCLAGDYIEALIVNGGNLFAGANFGVFLSTDNGNSWTGVTGWPGVDVNAFTISDSNLFAGTIKHGIFLSNNNGINWTAVDSGLSGRDDLRALAVSGSYLFAGGAHGISRRPLSEMKTSVHEAIVSYLPNRFSLAQNYPNPFNPSTNISFSLPSKSFVSLKVFDILGREVASIVSEIMSAGRYSRQWNAANMSNGIYFYRLQTGLYSETKKLVLLK